MAMGKKVMELLFRVKAKDAKKDIKEVGDGLGNVGKKGKIAQGGLNLMGKGFKGIGVAIKAAGIGLFVGLLSQLTGLFSQNQKTADTFQRIMLKLQPVMDAVGKVIELLAAGLEKMVNWITQAIGWIGDLIGVSNSFGDSVNASADALVNQRKKVQLLEAELGLLQLQYQREAELMRQIRDDESLSIQERIDANFELGKVLEEQLNKERSIALESLHLAEIELARNKNNVELQVALVDAKTKLAEIDERITGQRSEQLVNLNSLNREREAQQKEAAAKREEQLKKEAEMLQNLIDLQNEDIKVTKEKFRTINEQFDNAEEQNQKQIDEINKQMKAELDAHNLKIKNAKQNINLQSENTEAYKDEIKEREKIDEENKLKNDKIIRDQLVLFKESERILNMGFHGATDQQNERLRQASHYNETLRSMNFQSMEDVDLFIAKIEEEMDAELKHMKSTGTYSDLSIQGMKDRFDSQSEMFDVYRKNISEKIAGTNEEINNLTLQQIETSEQSAEISQNILATSADKKLEIEEKYAQKIKETEQSLIDTNTTLQEQANDELFLHFETAKEKEIRETEEKYERLLGLALNNAEETKLLEQEKEEALAEIRGREGKKMIQESINLFKKLKTEKDKQDKLDKLAVENKKKMEIDAAKQTLQMGVALAKKGTAEYKALASAETIMSTYLGASKALADVPTPFNFIQAGLIIAAGMKNLKEISKTKVEGGGSESMPDTVAGLGGGGDMGGSVPALPTFGDAGSDIPPVQAFVVETDISNAQALQSELDLQSTL